MESDTVSTKDQGCSGVGTAFPHLFALVTLFEDVGSKRLH